ncbi:hypothetical protein [Streptomyces sp. NPDC088925]|uniref:hypothetical protein n=1 Tax=Streptomyces sp. NPDC088925 TaxID=3365914 RepID=UPI0037F4795E
MSRSLPHPFTVLGFRRDGRPIHPILGADERDPSNNLPSGETVVDQATLARLLAREKSQGERAGVKTLLERLGFEKADELTAYIERQRDAETATLSELEKRERAAEEKAREAERRIAEAAARERTATRRTALAGLGAAGDDLVDAEALLRAAIPEDADEETVQKAAKELHGRRPMLFSVGSGSAAGSDGTPAPGGSPAGGGPVHRKTPVPGAAGLDMARRRGYIKE